MSGAQKSEIESGELVAPTVRTTQSFKDLTTLLKRTMETKKRNCDLQFLLVLLIRFYCMGKQHLECVLLCSLISFS